MRSLSSLIVKKELSVEPKPVTSEYWKVSFGKSASSVLKVPTMEFGGRFSEIVPVESRTLVGAVNTFLVSSFSSANNVFLLGE